jgi:nucleoside-diphosphate-sugar epimerase
MNILLTGGTGSVGKAAVARLVTNGHAVRVIGRRPGVEIPGAEYAVCDITDYVSLRQHAAGRDAIVHLAAIPGPGRASAEELFRINAAGTFNVFQAGAEAGIRRVVQASSINALGLLYGVKDASPHYFPLDEDHPCFTTDAYSFSKAIVEEISRYFWRREGISSVALRLPWVAAASYHERVGGSQAMMRRVVDRLLVMPEADRLRWLETARGAFNAARGQRAFENQELSRRLWGAEWPLDQETRAVMSARHNFWTIIDERDSAQAIEKALTADYEGSHPLHVHDPDNWSGIESETLAGLFYPEVAARKRPLVGTETLISIEAARRLIGFEPEHPYFVS